MLFLCTVRLSGDYLQEELELPVRLARHLERYIFGGGGHEEYSNEACVVQI